MVSQPSAAPRPAPQPKPDPVEPATAAAEPERPSPKGPKGERVVSYMGQQVGDLARQLAITQAMLDEKDEIIAGLRKELVKATSGGGGGTP